MSDHEFERQVQQKMDELRFRPSADVWKGVEQELDKDKKRRRFIYWWPAALLLLIGGSYLLYNQGSNAGSDPSLATRKSQQPVETVIPGSNEHSNGNGSVHAAPGVNPEIAAAPSDVMDATVSDLIKNQNSSPRNNSTSSLYRNRSKISSFEPTGSDQFSIARTGSTASSYDESLPLSMPGNSAAANEAHYFRADLNLLPGSAKIETGRGFRNTAAPLLAVAAVAPKQEKKEDSKRWLFGITAQAGMSGSNTGGIFNFQRASVVDVSGGILNSAFLPANTVIYKSSLIRPATGFSIGAFAQRNLNKHIELSAGLSFNRFTQSVKVGRKVYNSVQVNADRLGLYTAYPYYTRDAETNYAVHYDFIDLPVRIQYNVNPSAKIPVSVSGGVITSRLIGSNAVHFDGSSAGYFKNNSLLNNWQLGVHAGVAVTVMNKKSFPLTVGPSFRYQLSNTLSSQVGASRHILGVGLEARVPVNLFKRK